MQDLIDYLEYIGFEVVNKLEIQGGIMDELYIREAKQENGGIFYEQV